MSCGCNTPLETCNNCNPCNCCPPVEPEPLPVCPDPEPCDTAINAQCVMYTNGDLPCLGLTASGNPELIRLDDIIEAIEEAVCNSNLSTFFTEDTDCINLSGQGLVADPLVATLVIDPDDANLTSCGDDGVITILNYDNDDSCITLDGTGTVADPLTANINIGAGLLCTAGVLSIDPASLPNVTANNGLTKTLSNIQLGGPLVQNTTISLASFYLSIESSASDIFRITPTAFTSTFTNSNNPSSFASRMYQDNDQITLASHNLLSEISGAYWPRGFFQLSSATTSNTSILGSYYPTNGALVESQYTSYIRTGQGDLQVRSLDISETLASDVINGSTPVAYQPLVNGKTYIITAAGGIFTASGAANNSVGTVFTANSTPPTWGTGAVRPFGSIENRTSPYFRSDFNRKDWVMISYFDDDLGTRVPGVNDYMSIQTVNNFRIEHQIMSYDDRFDDFQYYAKGIITINNDSTDVNGVHNAIIGVDFPTCTGTGCSSPALPDIQTSSYTTWRSDGTGSVDGEMDTISPYVYFNGVAGYLGGYTYVGINNTGPSTFLDIAGSSGGANFRIREDYAPATSATTGNKGDISWGTVAGTSYLYVCVATNTWRRVAMSSF